SGRRVDARPAERIADDVSRRRQAVHRRGDQRRELFRRVRGVHAPRQVNLSSNAKTATAAKTLFKKEFFAFFAAFAFMTDARGLLAACRARSRRRASPALRRSSATACRGLPVTAARRARGARSTAR